MELLKVCEMQIDRGVLRHENDGDESTRRFKSQHFNKVLTSRNHPGFQYLKFASFLMGSYLISVHKLHVLCPIGQQS